MPINLAEMKSIILQGLTITEGDKKYTMVEANKFMFQRVAEEIAYYNSLSEKEKEDYDALTLGMMPRIPR